MNLEKDTSASPFWSPAPVLHITPSPFGAGGWDRRIVVPTQFLLCGLPHQPQSLCSHTSCPVSSPSLPGWLCAPGPMPWKSAFILSTTQLLPTQLRRGKRCPAVLHSVVTAHKPKRNAALVLHWAAAGSQVPGTTLTLLQASCPVISERDLSQFKRYFLTLLSIGLFSWILWDRIMFASCLPWAVPSTVMKTAH